MYAPAEATAISMANGTAALPAHTQRGELHRGRQNCALFVPFIIFYPFAFFWQK